MKIVIPQGASERAISLSSLIEVKSLTCEHGVAAVVAAPAKSVISGPELGVGIVMADKDGRFLAGTFHLPMQDSSTFQLTEDMVSSLARSRGQADRCWEKGDIDSTATGVLDEAPSGLVEYVVHNAVRTVMSNYSGPRMNVVFHSVQNAILAAVMQPWSTAVKAVQGALSNLEMAALQATHNSHFFPWSVFDVCAEDSEAGERARTFMARNPALGGLFLGVPECREIVRQGKPDRDALKAACATKVFVQGSAVASARMARIKANGFKWQRTMLHDFARANIPLDWLPNDTQSANLAGLAFATADAIRHASYGKNAAAELEPFSGCGGDWGRFSARMFEAARIDRDDPLAWPKLINRGEDGWGMTGIVIGDLLLPLAEALGNTEVVDSVMEFGREGFNVAPHPSWDRVPLSHAFARWLLFRGSNLPAALTRATAFVKHSARRTEAMDALSFEASSGSKPVPSEQIESLYAAWKPALPRRLQTANAHDFIEAVAYEVSVFKAMSEVAAMRLPERQAALFAHKPAIQIRKDLCRTLKFA